MKSPVYALWGDSPVRPRYSADAMAFTESPLPHDA